MLIHNQMETSQDYLFITGGLGFIGSHVVVQLINSGSNVVVFDNLSNSDRSVKQNIDDITKKPDHLTFIEGDIRNTRELNQVFEKYRITMVMHFAALKSVNESEKYPELYNEVNVVGTQNVLNVMKAHGCKNFIYSSSATVYGDSESPVTETSDVGNCLTCNYARNKYDMEQYMMANHGIGKLFEGWNMTILRYFNPIAAHPSGTIGEDPNDIPNNVFPYLLRVVAWTNSCSESRDPDSPYSIFTLFGDDYETRDGTCIRDYIHVQDLARAHVAVIPLFSLESEIRVYNVGTGTGSTVMELVDSLNRGLVGKGLKPINFRIGPRRTGDLAVSYATVDKIAQEVGFKTEYDIDKMCEHGLNFVGL